MVWMRFFNLSVLLLSLAPSQLGAQTIEPTAAEAQTVVDDSPFATARAAAMGGAISPLADGPGAYYYNPAGIGWVQDRKSQSLVRQLHFPYVGVSFNENSRNLYDDFEEEGARSDPIIGSAVVDAHAGKRQYARVSLLPNVVLGRLMVGGLVDQQLAAVPTGTDGVIDTRYVQSSGVVFGTSASDPKGRLSLGVSSGMISRTDVKGNFLYTDMADTATRKQVLADSTEKYSGTPINAGLVWRLSPKGNPSISVAMRDLGGTTYSNSSADGEDLVIKEDMTIGFGLSPNLGKWGQLNLALEGGRLSDGEVAINKKTRVGLELTLGGKGSAALLALRSGYNYAGASYGASINLGLLGMQYSNHAEDIGIGNRRVIERRSTAIFTVNVAEY